MNQAPSSWAYGFTGPLPVPNMALITQGHSGAMGYDISGFLMRRKNYLVDHYKKQGHHVVDETTGDSFGQDVNVVRACVYYSSNIYVWAHYGHGVLEDLGNLMFWKGAMAGKPSCHGPGDFTPHHSLAEVVLFSCAAGVKEGEWRRRLLAPGGILCSTKIGISPGEDIFLGKSPYRPLRGSRRK